MSNANRKRPRITAAAVAAGALAVAGTTLATSWAAVAQAAPSHQRPAGHFLPAAALRQHLTAH
jgi:hypothetical protein